MKLITVATGSKGNCYLLQRDNGRYIALDCGASWRHVLIGCNFLPVKIDFALVTHRHFDHSRYATQFLKNGIDVFRPENLKPGKSVKYKDVSFVPFEVPHDVPCYGYLIQVDGQKLIYLTDFGYCKYTFKSYNVEHWLIACNHIEAPNILEEKYRHVVTGHSSLQTVKDILTVNQTESMKNVIICHYSEDADINVIEQEIKNTVGDKVNVVVSRKGNTICL